MNENKQNTTLLTVIAVATLLVAVVGATFAYFTASSTQGSTSAINVKGGKMAIAYGDGSAWVNYTANPIEPSLDNIVAYKEFTVSATYDVNLDVGFEIWFDYSTQFSFPMFVKLTDNTAEGNTDKYRLTNKAESYDTVHGTGSLELTTKGNGANSGLENATVPANGSDMIAEGYFNAGNVSGSTETSATISLRMDIYYPDNGTNQDADKKSVFTGQLRIAAKQALTTTTTTTQEA